MTSTIGVIGTGYVGLIAGVCLAHWGHQVRGVDTDQDKIAALNDGRTPFYEPGLDPLLKEGLSSGRLLFSNAYEDLALCDVIFIAVGTPQGENGQADLTALWGTLEQLVKLPSLQCHTIVIKSTVPVGTHRRVALYLREANLSVSLISNPEFLREGRAVEDFLQPDRVMIGGEAFSDQISFDLMQRLYHPLVRERVPFLLLSWEESELSKYASNAFLAMKVAFINEIARFCDNVGARAALVAQAVGTDHRIGSHFLVPGPGYGGSCFPKDVAALVHAANTRGLQLPLIGTIAHSNQTHQESLVERVMDLCGGHIQGKRIAIAGLAFKAHTDDVRDTPTKVFVKALHEKGAQCSLYDPVAQPDAELRAMGQACDSLEEAANQAEALLILTEWPQFGAFDPECLRKLMKQPLIVDLRGILEPGEFIKQGFTLYTLGGASHDSLSQDKKS